MGMVLEQGILDKRHKYTGIDMSLPIVGSTPKDPQCSFDQVAADVHDWEDNRLHVIMCGFGELNNVDVWLQLGRLTCQARTPL